MNIYVQQTWTECKFGLDGSNVGGDRAGNTPGGEYAPAEAILYIWVEQNVGMAVWTLKFAGYFSRGKCLAESKV